MEMWTMDKMESQTFNSRPHKVNQVVNGAVLLGHFTEFECPHKQFDDTES